MRNDAEKKKIVQREKFSQVATSPGAQRRKKMPIVQNPAPVPKISQKSTSLIHSAETCQAMSEGTLRRVVQDPPFDPPIDAPSTPLSTGKFPFKGGKKAPPRPGKKAPGNRATQGDLT